MKRVSSIIAITTLFIFVILQPAAAQLKDWTVAVFLNADNNLDPFGIEDQKEMARVGSNANLNIVTLIDRERGPAQINYIEKNKIVKIKDMGELDMGDYRELVKFARFIKENYPAKHYCFALWNHGSGWKNKNINSVFRGISYDDSSNNHITNAQLKLATDEMAKILGQKVDVLNMDACLMQMVEVAHAVKDSVKFLVASEELEPGKGAPYDDILKAVRKDMTPKAFAHNWVTAFARSYEGGSQGYDESTQSAIDLSKFPALVDSINGLAKSLMSSKQAAEVKAALATTQKFDFHENVDLIHFVERLKSQTSNSSIKTACDKLLTAGRAAVSIYRNTGDTCKNAKGIAIYLPSNFKMEAKYRSLCFAKATLWDEMIDSLHKQNLALNVSNNIRAGSLDDLRALVASATPENAELNQYLLSELNFAMYSENALPKELANEFKSLTEQLAANSRR